MGTPSGTGGTTSALADPIQPHAHTHTHKPACHIETFAGDSLVYAHGSSWQLVFSVSVTVTTYL